ncbi:MAG: nuclear transport factor 2 family protein [Betaproteobacteria bacterium]|nr:MAG: nuclear transport factor 2 family protein [Betaproteobacteria bacterium]TMH27146.1 MAG: nuclear transport factor 2 family protein [Betaproteobacteria bacterium]
MNAIADRQQTAELCDALRRGIEQRDPALLASLYTDDCEHVIINRNSPPSRPLVLKGREALRKMFEDVCAREMTHCVEKAVIGEGSLAFHQTCQYPDGTRVVVLSIAQLRDGKIFRETAIDSWDE